jgi:AhpD family alkylhydroperoxidase
MKPRPSSGSPRIQLVDVDDVAESAQLFRLLAKSNASLKGYLGLRSALTHGRLGFRLRDLIGIFVAEANGCAYTLSSQVAAARRAGIEEDAIADARHGRAADARTDATLRFVNALVHAHGNVNDAELAALRAAGFGDGEIVEIVSNVGFQLLTSYAAICAALRPDDEPVVPHVYGASHESYEEQQLSD